MFIGLFLKECRQILKCTTYYILVICMVLFYYSQLGELKIVQKPVSGQESYGMTYSKDEKIIMDKALETMIREYTGNRYAAYPIGFYKKVTLNLNKQNKMRSIILEITQLTDKELTAALDEYITADSQVSSSKDSPEAFTLYRSETRQKLRLIVSDSMTYEHFKELMKQADKLIGGGSNYSESFLLSNAWVPMTYEEAVQNYDEIMQKDHLSGAYMRLFCDYMGILLAILPVFLAVTRGLRDKRAKASQLIYSRKAPSFTIIMSRYLSMVLMVLLPILVLAGMISVQCIYIGISEGITVDALAFLKYSLGWLLPEVMISTSVGVVVTELTETAIAIVIMGLWWFISLFMGVKNMLGGYGWNLIPRHNDLGNYQVFHDNFGILAANRLTYTALAVVLAVAAVILFDLKRKGKLIIHGKISSDRESKS